MALLDADSHPNIDITNYATVLSYTNSTGRDLAVLAKIELGSNTRPIVGSGFYVLSVKIDGTEVLPQSGVQVTTQRYVTLQSRHLSLQTGQSLVVQAKGVAGDTGVDVESVLIDVTPALFSDLAGVGSTIVDHNYGGTDVLKITDPDGVGVQDAVVTAFLASDYTAGNRSAIYVKGRANTNIAGRWRNPISLDPGSYMLVISKPTVFETNTHALTVT